MKAGCVSVFVDRVVDDLRCSCSRWRIIWGCVGKLPAICIPSLATGLES